MTPASVSVFPSPPTDPVSDRTSTLISRSRRPSPTTTTPTRPIPAPANDAELNAGHCADSRLRVGGAVRVRLARHGAHARSRRSLKDLRRNGRARRRQHYVCAWRRFTPSSARMVRARARWSSFCRAWCRQAEARSASTGERSIATRRRRFKLSVLRQSFRKCSSLPIEARSDNIFLGCDGLFRRSVPRARRPGLAADLLGSIANTKFDAQYPGWSSCPLAARQLVVLARALVSRPRILILDEVTAALDFADRESVFQTMEAFSRAGGLILFISHRMDEVLRLAASRHDPPQRPGRGHARTLVPFAGADAQADGPARRRKISAHGR